MSTARTISAREANQKFAELLRAVEAGAEFVVTRRGKPIARVISASEDGTRTLTAGQEAALERTLKRLSKGWPLGGGRLDRASLHDR
jgi:prevent-host-death family protein